nr:MAG TPA: hypothetical protein [Caudoviricetes sp.]DAV89471.1 MAG TPA: hypothetical protein [Caudoviricetes sp.]
MIFKICHAILKPSDKLYRCVASLLMDDVLDRNNYVFFVKTAKSR